jgi:hypothetical protein
VPHGDFATTKTTIRRWFMASILYAGESLYVWDKLISPDERFELVLQSDGNLVAYKEPEHKAYWATDTVGSDAVEAKMQPDGNLVLYKDNGEAVWATGAHAIATYLLELQSDGNLVIYKKKEQGTYEAIWAIGVWKPPPEPQPEPDYHPHCCTVYDGQEPIYMDTIQAVDLPHATGKCNDIRRRRLGTGIQVSRGYCRGDDEEG